ncbi:MAG: ATP-binding protein [Candidatus Omnitrophica bacterium]|nr:ATP-binding protein [Candidatus Omnitrophota bacterium]
MRETLSKYVAGGNSNLWTYAISIFLIVLGYDPIRNLMMELTDRYLFQKKYDYQKLLKDASKGISNIESLERLFGLVVHFITMRMRVSRAAILTKDRGGTRYDLEYQRGYEKNYLAYCIEEANPLIQYLVQEKEAIDIEAVKEYVMQGSKKRGKGGHREYDFNAIKKQMDELGASCCVPSFLGKDMKNVLTLGEKKSGDYYTSEDLNVLFTLAQESAIAIENARLYDEAIKKTHELERINEALEAAKSRLTDALKETETANKQLQDTQVQLIHEQKMATLGRLAASVGHEVNNPLTILSMNVSRAILKYRKNPDLKVSEILEVFQKMEQNISRIKAVVNTLTGLLKKSEKGKFEPLSLKLILEETLPLVQFQTYLDNLAGTEVEFNISGNVPLIRGDLERLQEVFLNLFINAYHAMAGRRNPHIKVTAEVCPEDTKFVVVNFTDNGSGMSEETMKKIFNYGYTTKPPGKGSGMGLYMCKYIIELHGGEIKVKSKLGLGTCFSLTLPVYEETKLSDVEAQAKTG